MYFLFIITIERKIVDIKQNFHEEKRNTEYNFHLAEMFIVYTRRETFSRHLIRVFQANGGSSCRKTLETDRTHLMHSLC